MKTNFKTAFLTASVLAVLAMPSLSQAGNEVGATTNYGDTALTANVENYGTLTGLYNSAFGYHALMSNVSGNGNTATGYKSLESNRGSTHEKGQKSL